MEERGETPGNIETRLKRVEMELDFAPFCDYLILNDDVEAASHRLEAIILAERSRRDLLNLRVDAHLPRHRFAYGGTCIPAYNGDVLVRDEAPRLPTFLPVPGELPHEAALRALAKALSLEVSADNLFPAVQSGDFAPPLVVEMVQQPQFEQITFYYLYLLPERIAAPEGCEWIPCPDAPLPPKVIEACLDSQVAQKS
jgi:hypothetical protein